VARLSVYTRSFWQPAAKRGIGKLDALTRAASGTPGYPKRHDSLTLHLSSYGFDVPIWTFRQARSLGFYALGVGLGFSTSTSTRSAR
jgi:hypothetical protein